MTMAEASQDGSVKHRVIVVGVGGATCCGKTTVAKHLRSILPDSLIIHQDDFAPPQELVPFHPVYNVQDWDAAPGAIQWTRLIDFLQQVKKTGVIPPEHYSHDHLNEQTLIPIADELKEKWAAFFEQLKEERERGGKEKIIWALMDGFLLYWHQEVIDQLDVRIMLRVPHDVLKQRRQERHGYHTAAIFYCGFLALTPSALITARCKPRQCHSSSIAAVRNGVQSDPEGALWRDPPHYWEQVVYPAYVDAHRDVFVDGDVEKGVPGSKVQGLLLLDALELTMGDMVDRCCTVLSDTAAN